MSIHIRHMYVDLAYFICCFGIFCSTWINPSALIFCFFDCNWCLIVVPLKLLSHRKLNNIITCKDCSTSFRKTTPNSSQHQVIRIQTKRDSTPLTSFITKADLLKFIIATATTNRPPQFEPERCSHLQKIAAGVIIKSERAKVTINSLNFGPFCNPYVGNDAIV